MVNLLLLKSYLITEHEQRPSVSFKMNSSQTEISSQYYYLNLSN